MPAWARAEILLRFLPRDLSDSSADSHLTFPLGPVEQECGARIRPQFGALAALIVRVENEAVLPEALQQHNPCIRRAFSRCRRKRHRVWLGVAGSAGLLKPYFELLQRVRRCL